MREKKGTESAGGVARRCSNQSFFARILVVLLVVSMLFMNGVDYKAAGAADTENSDAQVEVDTKEETPTAEDTDSNAGGAGGALEAPAGYTLTSEYAVDANKGDATQKNYQQSPDNGPGSVMGGGLEQWLYKSAEWTDKDAGEAQIKLYYQTPCGLYTFIGDAGSLEGTDWIEESASSQSLLIPGAGGASQITYAWSLSDTVDSRFDIISADITQKDAETEGVVSTVGNSVTASLSEYKGNTLVVVTINVKLKANAAGFQTSADAFDDTNTEEATATITKTSEEQNTDITGDAGSLGEDWEMDEGTDGSAGSLPPGMGLSTTTTMPSIKLLLRRIRLA